MSMQQMIVDFLFGVLFAKPNQAKPIAFLLHHNSNDRCVLNKTKPKFSKKWRKKEKHKNQFDVRFSSKAPSTIANPIEYGHNFHIYSFYFSPPPFFSISHSFFPEFFNTEFFGIKKTGSEIDVVELFIILKIWNFVLLAFS